MDTKTVSKQKVQELIQNAPTGITGEQIVKSLLRQGYSVEGLDVKPTPQTPQVAPVPQKDLLQKTTDAVTSIFPGKQVGEAIGTLGGYAYTKAKDAITGSNDSQFYDLNGPSVKQVVGDVAKGAALVGGLELPAAGTVLGKAAQFGTLGAISGAGQSAIKNNDYKTIATDAFKSGLTGAVIGGAVGVAEKGINAVVNKSPEALYNNALKVSQKIKLAGKSPSEGLIDEGTWGSLGSIKKAAQDGIDEANTAITQKLSNTAETVKTSDILQGAMDKLKKSYGSQYTDKQLEEILLKSPVAKLFEGSDISATDANVLRQQVDKMLGDRFFLSSTESPITKEALGAVNNSLRETVKKISGTDQEFKQLSKWIQTNKVVDSAISKADSKFGVGLYDILSGTGGAVVGGLKGDNAGDRIKNAVIGGVTGIALEKGLNSPLLKTGLGQVVSKIGDIPTDSLGRISKTAVIQLIGDLLSNNPSKNAQN